MNLQLLTTEEVANLMHCSVVHVSLLKKYKLLEPIKIGKNYMYIPMDLEQFYTKYKGKDLSNEIKIKEIAESRTLEELINAR